MAVDLTSVFAAYLSCNRGPMADNPAAREPPDYGLSARLDRAAIELAMTFRAGSAYCCFEWGCHLDLKEGMQWVRLRQGLASLGIDVPNRMELYLVLAVEAGSLFFDFGRPLPGHRGCYELFPSKAKRIEEFIAESCNLDDQPHTPPNSNA